MLTHPSPSRTLGTGDVALPEASTTTSPHPSRVGFTLIELLVVIAIIAVLASMLLPAIGLVRTAAHKVACQSNMRQVYVAISSYANDWEGRVMHGLNYTQTPFARDPSAWGETWGQTAAAFLEMPITGPLSSPSKAGIFNCPVNRTQREILGLAGGDTNGSYTGNFDSYVNMPWNGRFFAAQLSRLRNASSMLAFWDGSYYRSDCWYNDGSGSVPLTTIGHRNVRYAHGGAANLLYADGHVDATRRLQGRLGQVGAAPAANTPVEASNYVNGAMYYGG